MKPSPVKAALASRVRVDQAPCVAVTTAPGGARERQGAVASSPRRRAGTPLCARATPARRRQLDRHGAAAGIRAVHRHGGRAAGDADLGGERLRLRARRGTPCRRSSPSRSRSAGRARSRRCRRRPRRPGRRKRAAVRDLRRAAGAAGCADAGRPLKPACAVSKQATGNGTVTLPRRVGDRQRRAGGAVQAAERQRRAGSCARRCRRTASPGGRARDGHRAHRRRAGPPSRSPAREGARRDAQRGRRRPCRCARPGSRRRRRRAGRAAPSGRPRAGGRRRRIRRATTRARAFLHVRSARCSAQSRSHSRGDCSPPRQARSRSPRCSSSSVRRSRRSGRPDAEPRPRPARPPRQRALLAALQRPVPRDRARCASASTLGARCAPRSWRRAGRSCATSGACRTRAAGSWRAGTAATPPAKLAPDGSYRLKVSLSGRHIELLNPLTLDTAVRVLGTNVSRRVISPDCDSHGDRVIVVVRGARAARGPRARGAPGRRASCARCASAAAHVRSRSAGRRYAGKRCTTAPGRPLPPAGDRPRRAGQHARGRPRRDDCARRRPLAARPLDRRRAGACASASRPTRAACGSSSRGSERPAAVLARGTQAPAAVARVPAAARGRRLRRQQPPRGAHLRRRCWRCAARSRRTRRAAGQRAARSATLGPIQRRLDALGIRFDALTPRDARAGALDGYKVVVVPPVGGSAAEIAGIQLVTQPRRDQPRARFVIPAALSRSSAPPVSPACSRAGTGAARLAVARCSLAARTLGAARLAGRRPHVARARSAGRRRARRGARARRRRRARAAAPAAGPAVRRLPRRAVPLPGAHRQPGREPARPALRRDRRGLARARRSTRCSGSAPVRLPPRRLALPLLLLVAWEARLAGLERRARPRAPRRSRSTRSPSACCWRRSWRIRRRCRGCADLLRVQVALALAFAAVGVYQVLRHDIWWNRKLMVSNAFSSFFRANSIFYDPSIFGRYQAVTITLVFAALLFGTVRRPLAAAIAAGAGLGRDPDVVLPVGARSRSARPSEPGSCWRSAAGSRGCCCWARWPWASGSWPCRRCATPASTA